MRGKESQTRSEGQLTTLRIPESSDAAEFIGKAGVSVGFHTGKVSPPVTRDDFEAYIRKNESEADRCFLVIENGTGEIAGAINISQIFLKGFCSAYLGYYLFEGFSGRGLMTDGLKRLVSHAFRDMGLHRLEANIQPHNMDSIAVVRRCGFTREGFSRKYLFINGEWRDHERWAIIIEDWEAVR